MRLKQHFHVTEGVDANGDNLAVWSSGSSRNDTSAKRNRFGISEDLAVRELVGPRGAPEMMLFHRHVFVPPDVAFHAEGFSADSEDLTVWELVGFQS